MKDLVKRIVVVLVALIGLGTFLVVPLAGAGTMFVYSVKVLCGPAVPHLPITIGVIPEYRPFDETLVNIHNFNPGPEPKQVQIFWKVSVASYISPGHPSGIITPYQPHNLTANESVKIVCQEVLDRLGEAPDDFTEAFVEIVSPLELSVVAVHREWICVKQHSPRGWQCREGAQLEIVRYTPFQVQFSDAGN